MDRPASRASTTRLLQTLLTVSKKTEPSRREEFEQAARLAGGNLLSDFWGFLKESKKWWLLPLLVALALLGALVLLGGTGVAPFIYSLF